MSDTPRTDEAERKAHGTPNGFKLLPNLYVSGDFARQLERELNRANQRTCVHHTDAERAATVCPVCTDQALTAARAVINEIEPLIHHLKSLILLLAKR